VWDTKKASEWYRKKLGFEVSEQGHWVAVKPPGGSFIIHLCGKCEDWEGDRPGGQTGIFMEAGGKEKTYKELKSRGVEFEVELAEAPWGGDKYTIFKHLDGNKFWM
jgi:uncharacterized glyoxalase superfamily protein PhnB